MLSDTEFKGEGPAPSGSRPPLVIIYFCVRRRFVSDARAFPGRPRRPAKYALDCRPRRCPRLLKRKSLVNLKTPVKPKSQLDPNLLQSNSLSKGPLLYFHFFPSPLKGPPILKKECQTWTGFLSSEAINYKILAKVDYSYFLIAE